MSKANSSPQQRTETTAETTRLYNPTRVDRDLVRQEQRRQAEEAFEHYRNV